MEPPKRVSTGSLRAFCARAGSFVGQAWSAPQRRALGVLLVLLAVVVLGLCFRSSSRVGQELPDRGDLAEKLLDTIDPNSATAAELRLLPRVGPALAERIIQCRQQRLSKDPGRPAFERVEDLREVSGIGPAMVEHLRPHLRFGPAPGAQKIQ